jgi:hypothetical protein
MIDSTAGGSLNGRAYRPSRSKSAVLIVTADPRGASMDADLDLLLTAVYVTADDLLPERPENARRIVTDAEVVSRRLRGPRVGRAAGDAERLTLLSARAVGIPRACPAS